MRKTMVLPDSELEDAAESPPSPGRGQPLDLVPGFRDRLLLELDTADIAPTRRIPELSRITGRASATVRRWIDPALPGLPDIESLARLCQRLRVDMNYMLGLTQVRLQLPAMLGTADREQPWVEEVKAAASRSLDGSEPMVMHGDDMAPRINDGDLLFVDRGVDRVIGNGIYVVEYLGREMIRIVEDRLSEGLLLRCANEQYADVAIPPAVLSSGDLRISGKVVGRLSVGPA